MTALLALYAAFHATAFALGAIFALTIVATMMLIAIADLGRRIAILRRELLALNDRIPIWWDGKWE